MGKQKEGRKEGEGEARAARTRRRGSKSFRGLASNQEILPLSLSVQRNA